jgi:hypothetical protein
LPVAARATPDRAAPPDAGALDRAAARIGEAHRPLVVAGHGAARPAPSDGCAPSARRGRRLCWRRQARGVMPDPHPLMLGPLDPGAAAVVSRADLLVLIGVDPTELAPWAVDVRCAARARGERRSVAARPRPRRRPRSRARGAGATAPDAPRADWDVAELDRLKRARATIGLDTTRPHRRAARELTPAGTTRSPIPERMPPPSPPPGRP